MTRKPLYLDYAATTPIDPAVLHAMLPFMTLDGCFGNSASSAHCYGWDAKEAIERARKQIATVINAQPCDIIWTSGATESNNLAIQGVARAYSQKGCHFITCKTEHKAVLDTFHALEQQGCEVTYLGVEKNGLIDLSELAQALRKDTVLVSIMHANNETGVIQDIQRISEIVHANNTLFHTDAAQSAGKLSIDVEAMGIDLLSISAHKIYGPKGIGALYVRQTPRVRVVPLIYGGGHERGIRSGTLPTHQIVGFGAALEIAEEKRESESVRIAALRDTLFAGLFSLGAVTRNGDKTRCLPGILNVSIAGVEGEALLMGLEELAVSAGSACNSHTKESSYVLSALGVSQELAHSSVRISLGRFTEQQHVDFAIQTISKHVAHLRQLSPYCIE